MKKSKAQKENKSRRHRKARGAAYPYVNRTVTFVFASMFLFAPVMLIGLDKAKSTVADAQNYLTQGYYDVAVDEKQSDKIGKEFINTIKIGSLLGTVTCEKVGLNEKVYYGNNRVSLRNGAGLDNKSYLFGMGGTSKLNGCSSSSFGSLYNIEKGDIITVTSNLGTFKYKVYKTAVSDKADSTKGDTLLLSTAKSSEPFAALDDENYYVYASLTDGEVQ